MERVEDNVKAIENCLKQAQNEFERLPRPCLGSKRKFREHQKFLNSMKELHEEAKDKINTLKKFLSIDREIPRQVPMAENFQLVHQIEAKIPQIGIQMDSLLDLRDRNGGWKIFNNSFAKARIDELKKKEIVTVAVLGMYDAGKSWLCNELSGRKFSSGYNERTGAIEICYPTEEDNLFGLVDTPGSQEAIRMYQDPLKSKVEAYFSKTPLNDEISSRAKAPETMKAEEYFERYRLLHADAKMIQEIKEKFITRVSGITLLVVNKLSAKEQEMVYKCLRYYKAANVLLHDKADEKSQIQKKLFVVHNFKMLREIEAVERQTLLDIEGCFDCKKELLNAFPEYKGLQTKENQNQSCWIDKLGIFHLVLAAKDSPAGEFYNLSTMKFLKETIKVNQWRKPIDLADQFLEFANEELKKLIGKDIQLEYHQEKTAIIAKNPELITLEGLAFDELGNFIVTNKYTPRYSKAIRKNNTGLLEIVYDVESLDTMNLKCSTEFDEQTGWSYLLITGEKPSGMSDVVDKEVNFSSRESGKFEMRINLVKNHIVSNLTKEELVIGITRYNVTFEISKAGGI